MQTLETLRRSLKSTQSLGSVVRTMKTLAAVNIRQYEGAAAALQSYAGVVELGLQIALREQPSLIETEPTHFKRTGVVVFGSDTGLCGRFNEQVVDFAVSQLASLTAKPENVTLITLGLRAGAGLEAAKLTVEQVLSLPTSLAGLTLSVQQVLQRLEAWVALGTEHLILVHNQLDETGSYAPRAHQLYPLDAAWLKRLAERPWMSRSLPTYSLEHDALFAALVREYLFVGCYRALAESLACENAARLAAMQAAEDNIEARLGALRLEFNQQRQSAITEELLDIIGGSDMLAGPS